MTQFKQRLLDDHAELESRLRRLADSVDANDPCSELRNIWAGFESNLLDHLDTEERCFFPLVAREHRAEIEALRAEHQHIRSAVAELGVCVELHTLRKQTVTDLIEFLRRHSEHEGTSLYEWSERQSEGRALRSLFAMFERRAHREGSQPASPVS
jgi:hemerythrin-like domain-containing protein